MKEPDGIEQLAEGFERSRKLLTAIGDESRQQIILTMMGAGDCNGVRAVELAEQTHLSRPAVSHHLQIMKDAGLLKTRKEGTRIYYFFDPDMTTMGTRSSARCSSRCASRRACRTGRASDECEHSEPS